jgi:antitoxin ParD1/3/4
MPTRNVNLTDELDRFVAKKVKTGLYENASEVVRAGLRTLEREERQYEAKLAALRATIDEGDASGVAEGDVSGRVRKALKLPASSRKPWLGFVFRVVLKPLAEHRRLHPSPWGKTQAAHYIRGDSGLLPEAGRQSRVRPTL